jgi:hypothetical protein
MYFKVNCEEINSYEDFIEAFNTAMIIGVGGKWKGNLDAFNDYLSWPEPNPYLLIIKGSEQCKKILNYKYMEHHEKNLWRTIQEIISDNEEWVTVEYR